MLSLVGLAGAKGLYKQECHRFLQGFTWSELLKSCMFGTKYVELYHTLSLSVYLHTHIYVSYHIYTVYII